MPNWVFNSINNYTKEMYEKYKGEYIDDNGETKTRDLDFNKLIPEPEGLSDVPSGGFTGDLAKRIYKYNTEYAPNRTENDRCIKYDTKNPLKEPLDDFVDRLYTDVAEFCIKEPDKSLNEILKDAENLEGADSVKRKNTKDAIDKYKYIFGDDTYRSSDFKNVYDKFIESEEANYTKLNENRKKKENTLTPPYPYDSLNDMGKDICKFKEKYGYDNWYDWRLANWGTKWNACESLYDEDTQNMHFDTAWSIPEPILAKLAEENPEVNLDVYCEEEQGWFEEYDSKNGILRHTASGDNIWDEETDQTHEERQEIIPPVEMPYSSILKESKRSIDSFLNTANKLNKIL